MLVIVHLILLPSRGLQYTLGYLGFYWEVITSMKFVRRGLCPSNICQLNHFNDLCWWFSPITWNLQSVFNSLSLHSSVYLKWRSLDPLG